MIEQKIKEILREAGYDGYATSLVLEIQKNIIIAG